MAKLTAAKRNGLKKSQFALENKRKFPIEDKNHARNALARVSESENKGNISASEAAKVRTKAKKVLGKGKKK